MGKDLNGNEIGEGVYQLKSKKYCARVHGFGKRVSRTFESLVEARLWVAERQLRASPSIFHERMTLNEWFEYWIESIKKPIIKIGTYELYMRIYRCHIRDALGMMRMSEIKPLDCQEFIRRLSTTHKSSTVESVLNLIKQVFSSAVENEIITRSPIRSIRLNKDDRVEKRIFTAEEQRRFVEYITTHKFKYRDECLLVLETGMRVGEVLGLKWSDIDFNGRRINVNRSMCYSTQSNSYLEVTPKTRAGKRVIPLTDKAYRLLKDRKVIGIDYIFLDAGRSTRVGFDPPLHTVCRKLDMDYISMHGLRHSFATRCIECGMNPKTLQKIMGHESLKVTMDLYVHVTDDTLFTEMRKLNAL